MLKLEHIGIAVSNLSTSVPLFERLLNSQCYKKENVESEKVVTAFFKAGESKIELLESSDSEGAIGKFILRNSTLTLNIPMGRRANSMGKGQMN